MHTSVAVCANKIPAPVCLLGLDLETIKVYREGCIVAKWTETFHTKKSSRFFCTNSSGNVLLEHTCMEDACLSQILRLVVKPTVCSMVHYPLCLPPASSNKMLTHYVQSITLNERGSHLAFFMHDFFSFAKAPIHYSTKMNYSPLSLAYKKIPNWFLVCSVVLVIPNHPLVH